MDEPQPPPPLPADPRYPAGPAPEPEGLDLPPTEPIPAGSGRSGGGWLVAAVLLGLLAIAVGTVVFLRLLAEAGDAGEGGDEGASAEVWDPRVAELAAFVEDERGLDFEHPVEVAFLPEEEFEAEVTADEGDVDDEAERELARTSAELRALGLLGEDVDLLRDQNQLQGEGVLAFYSHDDQRIVVRGTELTPELAATVAHELTHALQDQHFGIEALQEAVGEDGWFRALALIEGDAVRIGEAYAAEHPGGDGDAAGGAASDAPDLEGVDPALVALFSAPYLIGPPFVAFVDAWEGSEAVDALFTEPPASEAALLDPRRALDGSAPVEVEAPTVPEGAEVLHEGDFGSLAWFLVLAAQLDPSRALHLVDGWAGDAYATYELDGQVCVAARFAGSDAAATDEVAAALDAWTDRAPGGRAAVARPGDLVELRSCDPGDADVTPPANDLTEAVALPSIRLGVLAGLASSAPAGTDLDALWCLSDGLVGALTPEQLAADAPSPELAEAVQGEAARCGLAVS